MGPVGVEPVVGFPATRALCGASIVSYRTYDADAVTLPVTSSQQCDNLLDSWHQLDPGPSGPLNLVPCWVSFSAASGCPAGRERQGRRSRVVHHPGAA
jgi:hypothetical protein